MTDFTTKWELRNRAGAHICIGLDPVLDKIPKSVKGKPHRRVEQYMCDIVDATHEYAAAYKPQIAFFEALGGKGHRTLRRVIEHIQAEHPDIPVILDYKRGDIGATNQGYVSSAFDYFGADAVTVHPYLGMEAMKPFLDRTDKTIIVLCRTSNPGAGEFQDVSCRVVRDARGNVFRSATEGRKSGSLGSFKQTAMPMYQYVAYRVAQHWNAHGNCAVVVGATYPEELGRVRRTIGTLPILLPGIGTQGGDLAASFRQGMENADDILAANSASAINYAYLNLKTRGDKLKYKPKQYAAAAAEEAKRTNRAVRKLLPAA